MLAPPAMPSVQFITGRAAPARTAVMRRSISAGPRCWGSGAGAGRILSRDGVRDGPHLVGRSTAPKARRVLDVGPQEHHRSLQIGAGLWRLLPLHVERDRNAIDTLARLDHVLRDLGILLEVRRLQMRLERVGILVNFE